MSRKKYPLDKTLPDRLRAAREAVGFTFAAASEQMGCTPGYLSNVEKRVRIPSELFRRSAEAWLASIGKPYKLSAVTTLVVREDAPGLQYVGPGVLQDERFQKAIQELADVLRGPDQKAAEWLLGNIQVFAERAREQLEPKRKRRAG